MTTTCGIGVLISFMMPWRDRLHASSALSDSSNCCLSRVLGSMFGKSSCSSSFLVLTNRSYFVKTIMTGTDYMKHEYRTIESQSLNRSRRTTVERTVNIGLTGQLKQSLVPGFKYTAPGSWGLRTQPNNNTSEPSLMAPSGGSSPYSVESFFEGHSRITSPLDEITYNIKVCRFPWFEPLRVMQDKRCILG